MKRILTLFVSLSLICIASISYGQAPVVTGSQSFAINENSIATTVVGTAVASNTPTSWAITVNTTNNAFAISAAGQITVINPLDLNREAGPSLSITVTATNVNGTSPGVPVTITLNDVNDVAPVVTATSRTINENLANGSNVGAVLAATDGDATATTFSSWTLTANPGGAFAINATTGQLTVATSSYLDREVRSTVVVTVTVSDGTNTSATEDVTINLNDVNDVNPIVTASQSFAINENLANATVVGTVAATDGDVTATTFSTWTLTANPGGAFAINAATGQLTVATSSYLDREVRSNVVVTVTVSDGTTTSATENVTINLNDVNDVNPIVTASQSFAIDENLANTSVVGTVVATDGDVTATTFSTWTLTANPGGAFAINATTGQLTVATSSFLDFETNPVIAIQVTVSDGTTTSAAQTVTINLNDLDEGAPTADAPDAFQTAQRLKSGVTSTSQIRSNENGNIYLVKNGTAVTSQAQINAAIIAKDAFLGRTAAVANTGYTITIPIVSLINDGAYNIVAVDGAGNVSTPSAGADSWLTVDNTVPTVAITLVSASPSTATSLDFTITFSESVTGVDLGDFLLATGTANDATGTIANLTGTGAVYTVTVNTIVGQNLGGSNGILNLDLIGSPGISDGAANAFAGSITTDNQYLVDNTKPALADGEFTLNPNGSGAETITFLMNETLGLSDGAAVTGFTVSTGTAAPVAIYTLSSNTITLTNAAADATWAAGTTVTYVPGNVADIIGNTMNGVPATAATIQTVSLVPGDIAFTGFNSDPTAGGGDAIDGFSFVLLKDLNPNTTIKFTDNGWSGDGTPALTTDESTISWNSGGAILGAGTEVRITETTDNNLTATHGTFTISGETNFSLSDNGDQVLAYQGANNSPSFIAGMHSSNEGSEDASLWTTITDVDGDNNRSGLPSGLTNGVNAISFSGVTFNENRQYKTTGVTLTGSAQQLRASMITVANWNAQNDAAYSLNSGANRFPIRPVITAVSIPAPFNYIISPTARTVTFTVHDDRGSTHTGLTGNIAGFNLSGLTRTNATTYTAQFVVTEGGAEIAAASDIPLSISLTSAQGNTITSVATPNTPVAYTTPISQAGDPIDGTSPHVVSINRNIAATTPMKSFPIGNEGTTATSVVFTVAFSEVMKRTSLTTDDFSFSPPTGLGGTPSISSILPLTDAASFEVTVTGYTGTGTIGLNYRDIEFPNVAGGSVTDLIGNPTKSAALAANGSFTGQTYSIVLPTPTSEAFTLTESNVTSNSVTLTWNPTNPLPGPTNYLVIASPSTLPTPPTDGTKVPDGVLAINLPVGTNTHTFSVQSGTSYNFAVYKYALSVNNSDDNIDYETTAPAIKNGVVTNSASVSSLLLNSTPVPISSIIDTPGEAISVMEFTIYDDGFDPISPNLMTLNLNSFPQTIVFNLREELAVAAGTLPAGWFSSSNGSIVSAVYSGKGTTNTITLTNNIFATAWNSATTISYSGTAEFLTHGKMQPIVAHPMGLVKGNVVIPSSDGTFVVPTGVTNLTVEAWGGGGAGGSGVGGSFYDGGGGGGGGGYSKSSFTVTPGTSYPVTIGQGGSPSVGFGVSAGPGTQSNFGGIVIAIGGAGGFNNSTFNSGPGGAGAVTGTGDVVYAGGAGFLGTLGSGSLNPGLGGGGGSSAGIAVNGNAASSSTGASAPVGGGSGGSGIISGTGSNGFLPGGGGGGSGNGSGGQGADGRIRITYDQLVNPAVSDWEADNSPFKFSKLKITKGAGNDIANWSEVIAAGGAELYDGINPTPVTGSVTADSITFSVPTAPGTVGNIPDASGALSFKNYTLKIWLKNNIINSLASSIDGLDLAFKLDPTVAGNLSYSDTGQKSSRLVSTTPAIESGANGITVVASKLVYSTPGASSVNTNPPNQIGVGVPFSANVAGQDPEVYALDANNNLDLNYNYAADITDELVINPLLHYNAPSQLTFVNGKLSLNSYSFTTGSATALNANTQILVKGPTSAPAPATTPAVSTPVWPVISSLTTVRLGSGASSFSSLTTALTGAVAPQVNAVANFTFTITDDYLANATTFANNDALPTLIDEIVISQGAGIDPIFTTDWSLAIQSAELSFGGTSVTATAPSMGGTTITFSDIPFTPGSAGYINDGTSRVYTLKIYLKNPVDATLRDFLDNTNLVFSATSGGINIAGGANASSEKAVSSATSTDSGTGTNTVIVSATQLDFTTQPPATQNYDINLTTTPVVKARDANQNLDKGYTSNATLSTVFIPAAAPNDVAHIYPLSTTAFSFVGGEVTLNSVAVGGATNTGINNDNIQLRLDDTPNVGTVASAQSSTIQLKYGNTSDIVRDGTFTDPLQNNIVTIDHREAPTTSSSVPLDRFILREGGASNDTDGSKTKLQSITLNLTNYENIKRIALYDETNAKLKELDFTSFDVAGNITFSSFLTPFEANDNDRTTKKFTVRVSFKDVVDDNEQINVSITAALAAGNSSQLISPLTVAGDALAATENQVEVVATQIDFIAQPLSASVSVPVSPQIIVAARDIYSNLDKDFTGTITGTGNIPVDPGPFTTANDPAIGTAFGAPSFAAGELTYPANFQFTVGDGDVKLTIDAGGISGTSAVISSITSYDSWLYFDPTFSYTPKIDFVNKQEDPTTGTSQILGRLILSDGGSATSDATFDPTPANPLDNALYNPQPGLQNQINHGDTDASFTRINDFTISLSNYQDIRKIALYASDGVTKIGADQIPAATVTFTGIGAAHVAPDDGTYTFYIRASFKQAVTDLDQIAMQVTAVTHNGGSKFSEQVPVSPPATIGGVNGATTFGDSSPLLIAGVPVNVLDVIATSLDFTTQATTTSSYAGINEPVGNAPPLFTVPYVSAPLPVTGASIVSARDKFANVDTDFNYTPTITQTAGPNTPVSAPRNFVNGILRLDGLEYTATGNGTLKVMANGIDSSNPPGANTVAIPGALVNVVNVAASLQTSGVLEGTGIPATYSIKGGSLDQTIFGVTFTASGATASEPTLKKFSISFSKSFHAVNGGVVTDILTNFRVLQGTTDITSGSIGGSLNYFLSASSTDDAGSQDIITVDLTSNPQSLFNGPLTYYLVADVDPTANLSTPSLKPGIIDNGYGSATDANIVVSRGTASGTVNGNVYTFASTKPPLLLTAKNSGTTPYSGQLNVDAGLSQIKLKFDVAVTSLDGGLNNGAELYNRTTNKKVADLIAVSGIGNYLSTQDEKQVINPLTFDLNFVSGESLQADEVYYVTIKKGAFDPIALTGTGISDQGLNFFGGISSNAILYFKISSDQPLKLKEITSSFNNRDIGTLSTEFDQFGTAYYMAVPTGATAPTNAQIITPSTYLSTKAAFGSYVIDRINALQTVSFRANYTLNQTYDIYIYAENDANPTPVPSGSSSPNSSGGVYGTDKVAGSGGPTFQITLPAVNVVRNTPEYLICPSSFVTLSEPIIIGESSPSQFKSASVQNFNILLPTGYEFDGITYPSVQLIGGDFNGNAATMNFISNTVLNISYANNPITATSTDYILISNLRIKGAAGSTNKPIQRFYGSNTLTPPVTNIASIGLVPATTFNFSNSYSVTNSPFPSPSPSIVNSIPDNYIDSDASIAGSVRLNPEINVLNDYNGSTFIGTGVTNDLLTLSAVPNNTSFNINMIHVDPNGCVSQKSQQYLVYDHRGSISKKLGTAYPTTSLEGTAQALVNVNFPTGTSPVITSPTILHNELAGYRLLNLSVDLPASENRLNVLGSQSQIISGSAWRARVKDIILIPPTPPVAQNLGTLGIYYDYTWDYSHILNAVTESAGGIAVNPYDGKVDPDPNSITGLLFRKSSGRNTYWTGGSLGKVEFTGVYRSSADLTVVVPFRQQVELFVPPVPVVEVGLGNQTSTDTTDPLNPINLPSNPGTPIFCEQGGAITINGFPAASATSSGVFDITTMADVPIAHNPLSFVDNGNGTATLSPYLISGGINVGFNNGYQDFKITYKFQENNSPAFGTSSIIVRVSANPIAKFNLASDLTISASGSTKLSDGMASAADAYCEKIPIEFTPVTSANIAFYNWDFGDVNSATNQDTTMISPGNLTAKIRNGYPNIGTYRARLTTTSDKGCGSINTDNFVDITVGSIPASGIGFDLVGISKADQITFTDRSTAASNATSFSKIQSVVWNYGDGTSNALGIRQYAAPGHYTVKSVVTTAIGSTSTTMTSKGCVRSYDRNIVILDKKAGFYEDDFEGVTNWQFIQDSLNTNGLPSSRTPSWALGTPAAGRASINSTPVSSSANSKVWSTGLTTTYSKEERSFLYSPAMDMASFIRPMVSFDANWDLQKDGLVLEYSTDNLNVADPAKVWLTVGKNNTGVKWFNDQVIGSKPGKQASGDIGWSGTSKSATAPTGWVESKNELTSTITGPRNNVVFRFAFATINDGGDGFAFDNFRVGERTRTILLENFTTTNGKDAGQNSTIASENSAISLFQASGLGTTVVKLNYHVGFTGSDPFNLDNPADPSARALYYNVNDVPLAFLDGGRPAEALITPKFSDWGTNAYNAQTLQLGQVDIEVQNLNVNTDGSIKFDVKVTALYDLPANTIVHVALIEQSVTGGLSAVQSAQVKTGEGNFDFVLKKMLPNALGTKLGTILPKNQIHTFPDFEYYPDPSKLYATTNDLAIIVFLQNEDTKLIYQTEYITGISDPPTVTGLEDGLRIEDVTFYPNPADNELNVLLPRKAIGDVTIKLFDQVGKQVLSTSIKNGEQKATLSVNDLPESMYLVRLEENGKTSMKKVVVVHQK